VEINLRKKTDFKNPYYNAKISGNRLTRIAGPEYQKLRVWKEYFFRFSE
jgi:hypothetical protein